MSQGNGEDQSVGRYAEAGVDIDAGNRFVDLIKPIVSKTFKSGVMTDIGGFAGLFSLKVEHIRNPVLVSSTDGVGTKLKIAFLMDKHDTIGIDLVAMCVNDIIVQGAVPLFLLDYLAMGKLDVARALEIIKGVAAGCEEANCSLIGERLRRCRAYTPWENTIWPVLWSVLRKRTISWTALRSAWGTRSSESDQAGFTAMATH